MHLSVLLLTVFVESAYFLLVAGKAMHSEALDKETFAGAEILSVVVVVVVVAVAVVVIVVVVAALYLK